MVYVSPDLGQVAYEAYCGSANGLSLVSGEPLPSWARVKPEIQQAWRAAAQAVLCGECRDH
jgi:hypothetical protein